MGRETGYVVNIRAVVTKQICVAALNAQDAEKLAHGLFTLDEVDARNVHQETVGTIVECRDLNCGKRKLKPWVLVENAGMINELLVDECATFEIALKVKRKRPDSDIMRRTSNHALTSEY